MKKGLNDMRFREQKIVRVGTIGDFVRKEHKKKAQVKEEYNRANKFAASGALLPLGVALPSVFASAKQTFAASPEVVLNATGQGMRCMDYVAAATASSNAVPVIGGAAVGKAAMSSILAIFDPIINLLLQVSFPTACLLILFKLFMGFFRDQGETWEGIGKISLVYIMIQAFPLFKQILLEAGNLI
jgi:hypothetical protein